MGVCGAVKIRVVLQPVQASHNKSAQSYVGATFASKTSVFKYRLGVARELNAKKCAARRDGVRHEYLHTMQSPYALYQRHTQS